MKRFLLPLLLLGISAHGEEMNRPKFNLFPDTLFLNDGTALHGLIVRNALAFVTLQQKMGERDIPKSWIRRIDDEPDDGFYFADIVDPAKLPPWRMVVEDLRYDDNVRSFKEIPATAIDIGYLKNIPYLSFRINGKMEMNIYGNPENPVCLEFGIYERNPREITKFKKIIRAYLAGILGSRAEVGAVYALPETGGDIRVGQVAFKVLPPTSPEAYKGWWISVYRPDGLSSARVSDAAYAKVTVPFDQVDLKTGDLRKHTGTATGHTMKWGSIIPGLQGFYRDKMGVLKPLFIPNKTSPSH